MVSRRAKFLLDNINQRIDDNYGSALENTAERTRQREEDFALEMERQQREQDVVKAKQINREHQRQNVRVDPHDQRARDAERVLGREMYGRARQRVYGS